MLADAWKVFSSELWYFRRILISALLVLIVLGFYYSLSGTYRAFVEASSAIQIIVVIVMGVTSGLDKLDRVEVLLPVSLRSVAWSRPAFVLFLSLALLILWIAFATFASEDPPIAFGAPLLFTLVYRFLFNTMVFYLFVFTFEVLEINRYLGFLLLVAFGALIGYYSAENIEGFRVPEAGSVTVSELVSRYGYLALIFAAGIILLYYAVVALFIKKKHYLR